MKTKYINLEQKDIAYLDSETTGEVILCLHGNSSSSKAYYELGSSLSQQYRILALDFPGHGLTGGHASLINYYSFQGFSRLIINFIDKLNVKPKYIIAHSLGGHALIQSLPKLSNLSAIVLISSPPMMLDLASFFLPDAPISYIFKQNLTTEEIQSLANSFLYKNTNATNFEKIISDISKTDGLFRSTLGENINTNGPVNELEILRENFLPCLMIGGKNDSFINPLYYESVAKELNLSMTNIHLLEESGHYPHVEKHQICNQLISTFFNNL